MTEYYQNSKHDFQQGTRYYLDTPYGQVKMFVEDGKVILQFFPDKKKNSNLIKKKDINRPKTP